MEGTPVLAWTPLQVTDHATKLVQKIAWVGKFTYRAEPRRVQERG